MAINRQNRNPLENLVRNIVHQTLAELAGQENDTQEFSFETPTRYGRANGRRASRGSRGKGSVTNPAKDKRLKRNRPEAET